jgi:hypothetical protein
MSLSLEHSFPEGITVKSDGLKPQKVRFDLRKRSDGIEMPLDEFLDVVFYVLTNTDLEEGDPRLEFVGLVRRLQQCPGWNALLPGEAKRDTKRLALPVGTRGKRL